MSARPGSTYGTSRWPWPPAESRKLHSTRKEVNEMAKVMFRYVRYALTSLTTVGFAVYKSS